MLTVSKLSDHLHPGLRASGQTAAICVIIAVILCSCAGTPPEPPAGVAESAPAVPASEDSPQARSVSGLWITRPEAAALIIIGISGFQSKPEAEIEQAREDAARKAAMYYGLRLSVDSVHNQGGYLDWFSESSVNLEYDTGWEQYKESLEYDPLADVLRSDGVVFVRFRLPATVPPDIRYSSSRNADGSPDWTNRPPQIEGFLCGVGFAGKHQRLKDAVIKSFESAAAVLITQQSHQVETEAASINDFGSGTGIRQKSSGSLEQFLVLELYFDPKTQGVYSLAIAKKGEAQTTEEKTNDE